MTMTNDELAEAVARFNKTPSNVEAADLADEIIRQLWAEREQQRAAMEQKKRGRDADPFDDFCYQCDQGA
jgi:hypothetical protein